MKAIPKGEDGEVAEAGSKTVLKKELWICQLADRGIDLRPGSNAFQLLFKAANLKF